MVQPNQQEQEMLLQLSQSHNGKVLLGFLDKIIADAVDIRNIPNENIEAQKLGRQVAVKFIEENISNRLKVLSGKLEPPEGDTYE